MSASPYSGAALRRSAIHFLTGKAGTALLTVTLLLVLVRVLPVRDYGVYVTLVAWLEVTVAVAGVGIPWMGGRFVPEFRLHASLHALRGLAWRLLQWLAVSLAVVTLCGGVLLQQFLAASGLSDYRAAALVYIGVLFADGLNRLVVASLIDPLMDQRLVRRVMLLRQGSLLAAVLVLFAVLPGPVHLLNLVYVELLVSALALVVALLGLRRHLQGLASMPGTRGWAEPKMATMWRTSLNMYGAYLLSLMYSPQVLLVLVTRGLGAESAAVFGFLRGLYDQVARYLPAMLLFNLVRPKLIASFAERRDVSEINRNANLAGKLSLFVLAPLIALVALAGGPLVGWLSGGRLPDSGHLLLGFMLILIPLSQRQLMESVAVATGLSHWCTLAAAAGLLTLPAYWLLQHAGLGLWAAVAAIAIGQVLFNGAVITALRRKLGYRVDLVGSSKLAAATLVALVCGAGVAALMPARATLAQMLVQGAVVVLVFLAAAWLIKPFQPGERERLNGLLQRKVFVW